MIKIGGFFMLKNIERTIKNIMQDSEFLVAQEILSRADIKIQGDRPWDLQVYNGQLYKRVLAQGSLGLGESYMEGWWDCKELDALFYKIMKAQLASSIKPNALLLFTLLKNRLFNLQKISRAFEIGKKHYDLGNDLYNAMLDKRLVYTCGYWKEANNLDDAQEAKLDLVCKKLGLKPGMKVLDVGCGWGSFLKYAAEKYGIIGVGITVSQEQVKLGQTICAGLPIEIRLQDYRDVQESFDSIVSLGMFEHVGYKNYRTYMKIMRNCLTDNGLFLLHTIGSNLSHKSGDQWIEKYIFPNSMLPSIAQIGQAIEGLFVMEDWHNFSAYYDKTLLAWYQNFSQNWPTISAHYDNRFYRMWKYYLLSCAGAFRARHCQLWQIVLSKRGVSGGYDSVR